VVVGSANARIVSVMAFDKSAQQKRGHQSGRLTSGCTAIVLTLALAINLPLSARSEVIPMQTGEIAIFNYDLTGQPVPPPYPWTVYAAFTFAQVNFPADTAEIFMFDGLNATGAVIDHYQGPLPTFSMSVSCLCAGGQDGIFSTALIALHGPFDITGTEGLAYSGGSFQEPIARVEGTLVEVRQAPEPSTLALLGLGLGLVGLRLSRRRRHSPPA
jgi:hypothetical protein